MLSYFILLLFIFFLCILFLDILLFITLYCYHPFIMLQYSLIVIQVTSGIISVQDTIMDPLLLQLNGIISSCRLLSANLAIGGDDVLCRSDNSGFILWVCIPCPNSLSLDMSIKHPWGGCDMLWHVWGKLVTCLACEVL